MVGHDFEDDIRKFLDNVGFSDVPKYGKNRIAFKLGGQEIDAFGRHGDLYVVVDAKMSTKKKSTAKGSLTQIDKIMGYRDRVVKDIKKKYKKHGFRLCLFIYWTSKKEIPKYQIELARENKISVRDDYDLKYYNDALGVLKNKDMVRNSFIKDVTNLIRIDPFETGSRSVVPAIKTRKDDKEFYTFQLDVKKLLEFTYVYRLETNNILFSYQRLIDDRKINKIRRYLNENGYFANNILVASDLKLKFDEDDDQENEVYTTGKIFLPEKPFFLNRIPLCSCFLDQLARDVHGPSARSKFAAPHQCLIDASITPKQHKEYLSEI